MDALKKTCLVVHTHVYSSNKGDACVWSEGVCVSLIKMREIVCRCLYVSLGIV
jgi:hypothetical protein